MEEIIKLIDDEIKWCGTHPNTPGEEEYEKGFISGLKQAKHFIVESIKLSD